MAHHKRKRPKHRRSGCLLCKPQKLTANRKAARRRADNYWRRHELVAHTVSPVSRRLNVRPRRRLYGL